eukprot:COSAG02_NODE_5408_length_4352_cov_8.493769_4_plen_217_part_00
MCTWLCTAGGCLRCRPLGAPGLKKSDDESSVTETTPARSATPPSSSMPNGGGRRGGGGGGGKVAPPRGGKKAQAPAERSPCAPNCHSPAVRARLVRWCTCLCVRCRSSCGCCGAPGVQQPVPGASAVPSEQRKPLWSHTSENTSVFTPNSPRDNPHFLQPYAVCKSLRIYHRGIAQIREIPGLAPVGVRGVVPRSGVGGSRTARGEERTRREGGIP